MKIPVNVIADTISNHDETLRIASEPGNIIVESALPAAIRLTGIQCSTAHITASDNALLYELSQQYQAYGDAEWCHFTGTGYLLRLSAWEYSVLRLKRMGLSKHCRRLIVTLMQLHGIDLLHLDAAGNVLPSFTTFDW